VWNIKTCVVSVITGATGTVSKSLRQYLINIPGNPEIKGLQKKTAILGTAHIPLKYKTFNMGCNITCSINCNYRTAATLYTLQILFVSDI
jgi:hypothetical protein